MATPMGTTTMELWCDGFLHGFVFNEEDWFDIEDEEVLEEVEASASLISAIVMRELEDKSLSEEVFAERMQQIQGFLPNAVLSLYELARSDHYAHLGEEGDAFGEDWLLPDEPDASHKVGRNEPCPCGSGLKYKKCCIDKDLALH